MLFISCQIKTAKYNKKNAKRVKRQAFEHYEDPETKKGCLDSKLGNIHIRIRPLTKITNLWIHGVNPSVAGSDSKMLPDNTEERDPVKNLLDSKRTLRKTGRPPSKSQEYPRFGRNTVSGFYMLKLKPLSLFSQYLSFLYNFFLTGSDPL